MRGYSVLEACNGEEASARTGGSPPGSSIARLRHACARRDIVRCKRSEKIRVGRRSPVLAVTAYAMQGDKEADLELRLRWLLVKTDQIQRSFSKRSNVLLSTIGRRSPRPKTVPGRKVDRFGLRHPSHRKALPKMVDWLGCAWSVTGFPVGRRSHNISAPFWRDRIL